MHSNILYLCCFAYSCSGVLELQALFLRFCHFVEFYENFLQQVQILGRQANYYLTS